jgi:hypothetical protein
MASCRGLRFGHHHTRQQLSTGNIFNAELQSYIAIFTMSTSTTAIAFFGATGGCGLAALRRSLEAGHTCVALARTPAKLEAVLPSTSHPNLTVKQGNALDQSAVASCLANPSSPSGLVDHIVFTVGGAFQFSKMRNDDPHVCENAMRTLLAAVAAARAERGPAGWRPRLTVVSTTGVSGHGRDVPALFVPLYHVMLKAPHVDKKAMEDRLVASGEEFVIVRPSLLSDGETTKEIRVGVEDPAKGWETKELGYFISREDVGRWIFEECLSGAKYVGKAVTLTT